MAEAVMDSVPVVTKETTAPIVVVDLKKRQSRRKIKRLREGRGSLMDDVMEMVEDLKEQGAVDSGAQPVVIVVRQKDDNLRLGPLGMR